MVEQKISQAIAQSTSPLALVETAAQILAEECGAGGKYDLTGEQSLRGVRQFIRVADHLLQHGLAPAARGFLTMAWNDSGQLQRQTGTRADRARLSFKLVDIALRMGDTGGGFRWALLTHADDILGLHSQGGGGGRDVLRTVCGMSSGAVGRLSETATKSLELVKNQGSNWSIPAGFAENVVVSYAIAHPDEAVLIGENAPNEEFPLSPGYFEALVRELKGVKPSTKAKGLALERLAAYLVMLLPGCVPRNNVLATDQAFETDLVVSNLARGYRLEAEKLGRDFLVECKNWKGAVGAKEVGHFLFRMSLTHSQFGVMLSTKGISGGKSRAARAATSLIRRAFHESGATCVVIDESDLLSLAHRDTSFWRLLLSKAAEARFGRSGNQPSAAP